MLTELKAYSSWNAAPTLPLSDSGRAELDLIQIRNIDGLNPVKASVNTSPLGSVDGTSVVGASVDSRNIVLTIRPNPDWKTWSYEALRRLIYSYFMPKRPVRLVFLSDDISPVEIYGVVESNEVDMFSKDQEIQVSIICPYPYFTTVDPIVVTGETSSPSSPNIIDIDYGGSVESGIAVMVTKTPDPSPTDIGIQIGDPRLSYFAVFAGLTANDYFEMSSVPLGKYVQTVNIGTGLITNLLSKVHVQEGSLWPYLQPGVNEFAVTTDIGIHDWTLTYYERYGGL